MLSHRTHSRHRVTKDCPQGQLTLPFRRIDQSRVVPVKGKTKSKTGKIYFIPSGAQFTAEETETIDETAVKGQ